jgi:O-antigen ligase
LLWAFAIYLVFLLPGLLVGYFTPALFFFFQTMRVMLFFYAVYLAVLSGHAMRIAEGLAYAVIASGAVSCYHALSGVVQAQGILGHQNLSGLATNLCIPLLLALGLTNKRPLFLLAVAAGAAGALAGGSRATMIFFAFSVAATILATVIFKPNGRTLAIAGIAALGLAAAAPFAIHKLSERNVANFEKDPERVAFEKTADLMIDDYPWGVGLNQYVKIANEGGYFDKAGVRWGYEARSTNVHNAYLLMRAEAGLLGLVGLLVWLLLPIFTAGAAMFHRRAALRELSFASGIAIAVAAIHSQYEWALVTATPQYLISLMAGVIAALSAYAAKAKRQVPVRSANVDSGQPNAHRGPPEPIR